MINNLGLTFQGLEPKIMETVFQLLEGYGMAVYIILFLYCALKSGSLPLFGGYAAQQGVLDPFWVAGAALAGGYLGDELRFYLAKKYGEALMINRPRLGAWLGKAKLMLEHYGIAYIFLYRYPKGMRTIGAFPVGLTRMVWSRFTLLNAASAVTWVVILVGSGYVFGNVIDQAVANNWGLASVVMLAIFIILTLFAWRRLSSIAQLKP